MRELEKVLNHDEKVVWEGKPQFWPYFVTTLLSSLFLIVFGGFFVYLFNAPGANVTYTGPKNIIDILIWAPLLLGVGLPILNLISYSFIHYAITDKRVIIQSGIIGRDFQLVDFDQITNASVNVGLVDKIFSRSSGSISIMTPTSFTTTSKGGTIPKPYLLGHIRDPYEVFKLFKKTSFDVKADVNYPNAYRPGQNPGYKTEYKPGEQQPPTPPQQ